MQTKQDIREKQDEQGEQRISNASASNFREIFLLELRQCSPSSLGLEEYLYAAYLQQAEESENTDGWRTPLWKFVRYAKAHPEISHLGGYAAARFVQRHIENWVEAYAKGWPWEKCFPGVSSEEDALAEFQDCWERVRYLPGHDPLQNAASAAERAPVNPRRERGDGYANFVSIAAWLQNYAGDRSIMLPCVKLGNQIGVEAMTISRYRRWAVEDGHLRLVKQHRFNSAGKGEATEFRFDFDSVRGKD